MESLGDILRRLQQQSFSATDPPPAWLDAVADDPPENACPVCGGRGWVRRDVPVDHPDFGRAFPCSCQGLADSAKRHERLQRFSNLGMLARVRFADLSAGGPGSGAEAQARHGAAYDAARQFAEAPEGALLLAGGSGVGKTYLAAAAANRIIERGRPVFFAFVPDLLDQLRASYSPDADLNYEDLFELVKNVDVLVLDDLGAQSGAAWADEKLFQIVNHRYVAGLPTIVTTSAQLDRIDGRLLTRLTDPRSSRVIDLGGGARVGQAAMGGVEPALRKAMTFDAFNARVHGADARERESLRHALAAAQSFASNPDGWLVLVGKTGCGKTHLAVAAANVLLDQGRDVYFAIVPDLLDHLRYTYSPDSRVTYDEQFDRITQAPILILDDMGAENATPWAREKLYQVIVHRHNARLPTIITMNEDTAISADAMSSRLRDPRITTAVHITAPDHRNPGSRGKKRAPR